MRRLVAALLFASLFLNACKTLNSQTFIEPYNSFVLGEGRHEPFNANIKNAGTAVVEVFSESSDGNRNTVAVLAPGDAVKVRIESDTKAIFKNAGTTKATLNLIVSGTTDLSMTTKSNRP